MVNELRYGWFKDRLYDEVAASLIPASTGSVQITVQGQTNLGVADARRDRESCVLQQGTRVPQESLRTR